MLGRLKANTWKTFSMQRSLLQGTTEAGTKQIEKTTRLILPEKSTPGWRLRLRSVVSPCALLYFSYLATGYRPPTTELPGLAGSMLPFPTQPSTFMQLGTHRTGKDTMVTSTTLP